MAHQLKNTLQAIGFPRFKACFSFLRNLLVLYSAISAKSKLTYSSYLSSWYRMSMVRAWARLTPLFGLRVPLAVPLIMPLDAAHSTAVLA